ncbi:hypothetical protein LMH87_007029 [Akanthomyces muscarius]|uniref:Uncharacterized protein n=1 Tax=Akanthomyces muscarius TaxID=2231603 RepID=A0A9W8QQS6_AKAMU|nr:hypothetical protein LMH87_007029 [Akanthomyces muscarius]KAJ4165395.1 hypothetical protein LMH87_007029 [Akanthomyces muscarius]
MVDDQSIIPEPFPCRHYRSGKTLYCHQSRPFFGPQTDPHCSRHDFDALDDSSDTENSFVPEAAVAYSPAPNLLHGASEVGVRLSPSFSAVGDGLLLKHRRDPEPSDTVEMEILELVAGPRWPLCIFIGFHLEQPFCHIFVLFIFDRVTPLSFDAVRNSCVVMRDSHSYRGPILSKI